MENCGCILGLFPEQRSHEQRPSPLMKQPSSGFGELWEVDSGE